MLRALAPVASGATLLCLTLVPEATRADNECGAASNGMATCAASTENFNSGIRYFVNDADGLTLTVEERTGGARRVIRHFGIRSTDGTGGFGIEIQGDHGEGAGLRLVVRGDTDIAKDGRFQARDGILVSNGNGSGNRRITGSVTVDLGADVNVGTSEGRFGRFTRHGISAIVEEGHKDSTTSNAGIRVINAGAIHATQQGIRAFGHGFKVRSPTANHLNGRIEITHSGSINAGDWGIHAVSERNADVAATVETGGTITAKKGIFVETKGAAGPGGSGNVTISSAGTITASLGRGIDAVVSSGTGTLSVTTTGGMVTASDVGIHAVTNASAAGANNITVEAGSSVRGDVHGIFGKHTGSAGVTVNVAGTVTGGSGEDQAAIKLSAAGPASVTLMDEFRINGDILFDGNDENDSLTLTVAEDMRGEAMGDIENVNMLTKTGTGTAYLAGAVSVAGSASAPAFEIAEGVLVLRGHVDLGNAGTFTVKDGSRLTVEVGPDDDDHGSVTAGTVSFEGTDPAVHVALVSEPAEREAAEQQVEDGITVFRGGGVAGAASTRVEFDDFDVNGSTVGQDGVIRLQRTPVVEPPPVTEPNPGGGGGRSGGNGGGGIGGAGEGGRSASQLVVGGSLAFLLWDLNLFDGEALLGNEGSGSQYGTLVRSFSSASSSIRSSDKGIEYRVQLLESSVPAATILPASGVATSLRANLGDGFHADLTGTPRFTAGIGRDSVSGSRYGLGAGWHSGVFNTDIGYSRAALRARSTFSNLEGLGELSGQYGLRHDRVQANARLRLAGAGLSLSPSLSLFEGAVTQDGYTASSRVWLSEVPSMSQDYKGWKAGLSLAPHSPLRVAGLRWRPELRLTTMQLASGPVGEAVIEQRDRAGALRLDTPAQASLPRTVHALGGALTVAGGENWALRGGYAAMLADDALEHAAGAQLRMRF